jgi:hypothetical protein
MKHFGSRFCCCLQERKAHNLVDPFDRCSYPVTENGSLEGVPKLGIFLSWRRKQRRLPKRRVSLIILSVEKVWKEDYIKDYTVYRTSVSLSNIRFI